MWGNILILECMNSIQFLMEEVVQLLHIYDHSLSIFPHINNKIDSCIDKSCGYNLESFKLQLYNFRIDDSVSYFEKNLLNFYHMVHHVLGKNIICSILFDIYYILVESLIQLLKILLYIFHQGKASNYFSQLKQKYELYYIFISAEVIKFYRILHLHLNYLSSFLQDTILIKLQQFYNLYNDVGMNHRINVHIFLIFSFILSHISKHICYR